jgi:hypothetical protein
MREILKEDYIPASPTDRNVSKLSTDRNVSKLAHQSIAKLRLTARYGRPHPTDRNVSKLAHHNIAKQRSTAILDGQTQQIEVGPYGTHTQPPEDRPMNHRKGLLRGNHAQSAYIRGSQTNSNLDVQTSGHQQIRIATTTRSFNK